MARAGWSMASGTWHRTLTEAVSYAACRTRGYVIEVRLVNRQGKVTHVVRIDTSRGPEGSQWLGGPSLGARH